MIRPRTIHRHVEAAPPPPPAPVASNTSESSSAAAAAGSRKRLLIVCLSLVFLYLFYSSFIRSPDDDADGLGFGSSDSAALRSSSNNAVTGGFSDEGEEEEEEEEEKPKTKTSKKKAVAPVEDEDEEETGDDEDSSAAAEDNDSEDAEDGGEEETSSKMEEDDEDKVSAEDDDDNDEEKPQVEMRRTEIKPRSSANNGPRDPARSVQSYFSNFGGNVVEIDREGSYKFVLVKFEDSSGDSALLVRGCPKTEGTHCKHHHAFSRAKAELEQRGFVAKVRGGGRITRHPSRRRPGQKEGYISVFGYSKTFGACEDCNKITCQLIKAAFPDHGVKYSNEGYSESDERKIPNSSWTKC